jgi:hypothetical protein
MNLFRPQRNAIQTLTARCGPPITNEKASQNQISEYKIPADTWECLRSILVLKNGFYGFANCLHVFPYGLAQSLAGTIQSWNAPTNWRQKYADLDSRLVFFAEDLFGEQFGLIGKEVFRFNPETGKVSHVCIGIDAWAAKILEKTNLETGYGLGADWQRKYGDLPHGHRLMPRQPFVLGGKFEPSNLCLIEATEGMHLRSELARQIRDLPDGTKINVEFDGS